MPRGKASTEMTTQRAMTLQDKDKKAKPEKTIKLVDYINSKPSEAFITSELSKFRASPEYKDMVKGSEYYRLQCKIETKKRMVAGCGQDEFVESKVLSNTKLKHSFLYKLVRQKINYLLSKPWSIQLDEKYKGLQEILETRYFTPKFRKSLQNAATDSIVEGKSWVQAYVDTDGRIKFKFVKGQKVKVYWTDDERNEVKAIMKIYDTIEVGEDGDTYDVTKVEFYNQKGCWIYEIDGQSNNVVKVRNTGKTVKETTKDDDGNFVPYFMYREAVMEQDEEGNPVTDENGNQIQKMVTDDEGNEVPLFSEEKIGDFGAVPFICIKYNEEELPLLNFIKEKNDDYDEVTSDVSDFIQDVPSSIKVVKGYQGTKAGQFAKNLATYRVIFVGENGAVENLQSSMDNATAEAHLDRIREDIYADGCGVDSSRTDSLGSLSGVALKYLYQDLDIDCNNLWTSIDSALHQIFQYICMDLEHQGEGSFYDVPIKFIPNMDGLINESEVIQSISNSASILSKKTLLANHPWVTNVEEELKAKEEEDKQALEKYNTYTFGAGPNPAAGGNNGNNNPNPPEEEEEDENKDE